MCEANAYFVDKEGNETLLLEMVDMIRPENEKLVLRDIFGFQKIVTARIKEMKLVDHKILLEKM